VPPDLVEGARNAVDTCLSVSRVDRVVLVSDRPTAEISNAIFAELDRTGAEVSCFVLEDYGERPIDTVPPPILRALEKATVSLLIVQPMPGELKARTTIIDLVRERRIRHAHMPGVSRQMMVTGMRADYRKVSRLQDQLLSRIKPDSVIHITTPAGTDLEVTFNPDHRWVRCDGIITGGLMQNLPSGQLYTTPENVEGTFVGDGAIGDWFALKYPDLADYPLTVEISQGRILDARSTNSTLARQFLLYVRSNPNGDRVGEFAIGTNLALSEFLGNSLQDENIPGSHLAFGGAAVLPSTGAKWSCKTHLPLIARTCDIAIDGVAVMTRGVFTSALLEG
jgi:leucyl aminopeptidase (aminopeptidase T)